MGRACKVKSRKIRTCQNRIRNHDGISKNHINDPWRHAGFFKNIHNNFGRIDLAITRFPDHYITHQRHTGCKVSGNRRKVKRRYCIGKPFQRTVFNTVPCGTCTLWLIFIDVGHELNVEPQKIDKFTSSINFSLIHCFGLRNHGRCVYFCTVRSCD